jgi:heptosyltransferase III
MADESYPDLNGVKKILVVKLRHHGDVLLSSPIFSILKTVMPAASISAYIYRDALPMLEGHPSIDRFHLYDRSWKKCSFWQRLQKEIGMLRQIRKEGYDLVINLTEGDRGVLAAVVSGAKLRVGFDPEGSGMLGKEQMLTHIVKHCPNPRHTVEKNLDALRRIGIFPAWEDRELLFSVPEEERKKTPDGRYIVIHPVSRWMFKCPPPTFFIELARNLLKKGERIVLSSSPDPIEMAFCKKILDRVDGLIDYSGKTTLKGLGALIEKADALISVDSVSAHLASALKTPVVVIFGPTSELNWGPWRHPLAKIVTQDVPCRPCFRDGCGGSRVSDCLQTLPVEKVLEAFYNLKSSPKYEERASLLRSSSSTVPDMSTFPLPIK